MRGGECESKGHLPSEFMLDGESITREDIAEKCKGSFSEFLVILEKLTAQNEHFYERDLVDAALQHHISEARAPVDLVRIKKHIETKGRWQNSNVIELLAKRFLDFGDQDNAIACFSMAYSCHGDWFRWRKNSTKYLAAIAGRDTKVAKTCLLNECYDSVNGSGGGYDTPPIAATGLDVLDEPPMLEAVFNDFLTHCESMFEQLPSGNDYGWLKDYAGPSLDENRLILQFCMEELGTPEIDHGVRLIRELARLAIARPESALPVLVGRTLVTSGRILRRLLMILHTVAARSPSLLALHQKSLAKLLDREDFFCRQTVMRILQCVSEVAPLESSVAAAVQSIERKFPASASHSAYTMPSSPSSTFVAFLKRNTLFDFFDQIQVMEIILGLQSGSLVATIEERLNAQDWSMDEERSRVKANWNGHVHPQGWPIVWITTEFQELAMEALWSILNEAVEKQSLSDDQIHWLWQTAQMVDSEYVVGGIMTRPSDIEPLRVLNKEAWLNELATTESFQIRSPGTEEQGTDWITVFEKRGLAHEEKFNVPYRQDISLRATLIPIQVYGGARELDKLDLTTERIVPAGPMAVTWEQARDVLMKRGKDVLDVNDECIPLVAEHQNPASFSGYWSVCTLASSVINEFNLSFEGFDLTRNGEVVAKYDAWQEGYQDESYTREKLPFGVRLRVRRDLLAEICRRYRKMVCIRIDEKRECYKSIYDREPDTRKDSKRYAIYHL